MASVRLHFLGGMRTLYRGGVDSGSVSCYTVQSSVFSFVSMA